MNQKLTCVLFFGNCQVSYASIHTTYNHIDYVRTS